MSIISPSSLTTHQFVNLENDGELVIHFFFLEKKKIVVMYTHSSL